MKNFRMPLRFYSWCSTRGAHGNFAKVEESRRGKLLYNAIISQLDSMGQAIPEQEKRQILMEVLKEMC